MCSENSKKPDSSQRELAEDLGFSLRQVKLLFKGITK